MTESNFTIDGKSLYAVGYVDSVLAVIDGGAYTNYSQNSLSWGHNTSGHTSWIQSASTTGTTLKLNPNGGGIELQSTVSSTTGVIYKGANRFIHDYNPPNNGTVDPSGGNVFVGVNSGNFTMGSTATNTFEASNNVGVGNGVMDVITIGYGNVASGTDALGALTSGYFNIAHGYLAGSNLTTGYQNVYSGTSAGRFITSGNNTTGNRQVCIGHETRLAADGDTNEIVIGYTAQGLGSNTAIIGNSSIVQTQLRGVVCVGGSTKDGTAANIIQITGSTEPGGSVADTVQFYEKDSSQGAGHGTLGLYLEEAVEAIGTFTPSHKLRVWINGVEYHIQLDAV